MSVCGIVLAAGGARRFGGRKQLAPLGDRPLVEYAVRTACRAASLDRVVVVLGAWAAEIAEVLEPGRAELVLCPGWRRGISASLQAGAKAAGNADWVVVTLGDEPRLPVEAIERVVATARSAGPDVMAVRARWDGRPGHPVALRGALAARAAELRGDTGARELLAAQSVVEVELGDLGSCWDVDVPEDLPPR